MDPQRLPDTTNAAVPLRIAAALASAALFLPLAIPLLTGRIFTMYDLTLLHLPARVVYARALAAGHDVAWTPAFHAGYYLHGEGQTGMYHPLHVALYRFLPLTAAFNLELVGSYLFAFAGMVLVLRRWECSAAAALVGAMAFTFSGFNLFHHMHVNLVAVGAHLPWLLWATDVVMTAQERRARMLAGAAFAAFLGSALLLGFPQLVLFCGIAVGMCAMWIARARRNWTGVPLLFGATLVGGALGAVQLLPTLDVFAESVRSDPTGAFRQAFSLHPLNLVQFLTPYVFRDGVYLTPGENAIHESVVYNGAYCTIALCWVVAAGRRLLSRPIVAWAVALALVATVFALGRHAGVYGVIAELPLFRWFRAPARYIFLLHFALGLLGAVVFDDLRAGTARRRWKFTIAAVSTPLVLGTAFAVALHSPGTAGLVRAVAGLGLLGVVMALCLQASRGRQWAMLMLPFALAIDLGAWGYRYVWKAPPMSIAQVGRHADLPSGGRPGEMLYSTFEPNLPVLSGFRAFNAYVGLTPSLSLDAAQELTQRLAGVAWRRLPHGWARVERPMPRVRMVTEARVTSDPRRDMPGTRIERVALVSTPVSLDASAEARADVRVDRPGNLVAAVESTGRAMLVTTERYDPGWRVTAGSQSLQAIRVNGDFLGSVVEPGNWTIEMRFEPSSLSGGAAISGVALTLLLALLAGVTLTRGARPRAGEDAARASRIS